jgi:hypothetical protein
MNTLVTNELFMDFIECPYRGYLRLTGALGRQTDFVELSESFQLPTIVH